MEGDYPSGGSPPEPSKTIGGTGYAGGPANADEGDLGQPQIQPTSPAPQPGGRAQAPNAA